jgi:hypothetical protein
MNFIDNQQAQELAKEEAKEQIKCQHQFETRHIELLDEDLQICSKCDINKKLYDLSLSTPCFGRHRRFKLKCWQCPLELLCQVKDR